MTKEENTCPKCGRSKGITFRIDYRALTRGLNDQ